MARKIVFNVDHQAPFKYKVINEKGFTVKKGRSTNNQFEVRLSKHHIYQVVINHCYMTIFDIDDYLHGDTVYINVLTTVASIFCFSQLLNNRVRMAKNTEKIRFIVALNIMYNFVNNGVIADTLKNPPNALETNSLRLFNFIANMLRDTVINYRSNVNLKKITQKKYPLNALQNIALNPFSNILILFNYGMSVQQVHVPTITSINQIGQMALTIKVNTTGAINFLPGGPAFIVFDKRQNVWISLNTTQGTDGSNTYAMVLNSGAKPTNFSPVFPILGGAYGVAYDECKDRVIFGSFGWGANNIAYNPWEGAITVFSAKNGKLISPPNGYTNLLHRVQGITVDTHGNYWMCSWGSNDSLGAQSEVSGTNDHNSSIVVYLNGNPEHAISYEIDITPYGKSPNYGPFSIVHDDCNNIFVSISGSNKNGSTINSAVIKLALNSTKDKIIKISEYVSSGYNFYKGIAINCNREIYVASFLENSVIKLSSNLEYMYSYHEPKTGPWGLSVDARGTIWVANFLPNDPTNPNHSNFTYVDFGVNQLSDTGHSLIKKGKFILPSGGDPVTLATGQIIQDDNGQNILTPLMRSTYAVCDAAGNMYVANNWKPSVAQDINGNPGGDGVIVFVGVGAPKNI